MLINLSNHHSNFWGEQQTNTAHKLYGDIFDISFPNVPAEIDEEHIKSMAKMLISDYLSSYNSTITTFHVMGEMTLTFQLVTLLKAAGFRCVASTSERVVSYAPDGTKNVTFNFVRFREY